MKRNKRVKYILCKNCLRKVPNKKWFIKNGCIWCDAEYHIKEIKHENI